MKDLSPIARHYTQGNLLHTIRSAVAQLGKAPEFVTIDDLAPVDEFHIGGRAATRDFLAQLVPKVDDHLLDIGCGIGGASRYAALTYNCRVSGIDLTEEFVETGRELCRWTGLSDRFADYHGRNSPDQDPKHDRKLDSRVHRPGRVDRAQTVVRVPARPKPQLQQDFPET
jgi:Cyclopropane fatty acid synthase and related methyltransferases